MPVTADRGVQILAVADEPPIELAERIRDGAFVGSRVYSDREAMLEAVPEGGTIAEMGVFQGGFRS